MRIHARFLIRKSFKALKQRAFRKSQIAWEFNKITRYQRFIQVLKKQIKAKKCPKLEVEIF